MQIKLKHTQGTDTITVPESWHDVPFGDYLEFVRLQASHKDAPMDEYLAELIHLFCKIDYELIEQLPINTVELIATTLLPFITQLPKSDVPEQYQSFDIANIQWRRLIRAQQIIEDINSRVDDTDKETMINELIFASADIAEALTDEDFKAQRTTDAFWCIDFFFPKLIAFKNNTASMKKKKKTKTTLNLKTTAS